MILGTGTKAFHAGFFRPANMAWLPHPGKKIRDLGGLPESLGRIGSLEIRLATRKKDIRKAQKLRFKVFFEEGGAIADRRSALTRRDICPFDRICDHLLIIDHDAKSRLGRRKPKVVGAYRLLRQEIAEAKGGFYTASEFDIAPLLERHKGKRFLELGRSCVHKDWRSRKTLELMWRGIWTYVRHHRIDVMIGCASFPGANAFSHALALSFLHHHASVSETWHSTALPGRGVPMNMIGAESIDKRRALDALPPLVKGYLRVGARFGEGAVIDRQFGTTDVLVVMPVAEIDPRYVSYFSAAAPMDQVAA